jgi:hypothetical protein
MHVTLERWVSAFAIVARSTIAATALVAIVVLGAHEVVFGAQEQEYDPICELCPAVYISSAEIRRT